MFMKYTFLSALIIASLVTACGGSGSSGSVSGSSSSTNASGADSSGNTSQPILSTNDPCVIEPFTPTYPAGYIGKFAIPSAGGRLPSAWGRAIELKDYYPAAIPTTSQCKDVTTYARNQYKVELDKIKAIGADTVWIANYGRWKDINKIPWQLEKSSMQIPETELAFFIVEAKKRGLKVYLGWQMYVSDVLGNSYSYNGDYTTEQMTNVMLGHRELMRYLSDFAAVTGVDGLAVDWQAFNPLNLWQDNIKEIYISQLSSTIDLIKSKFNGKLILGYNGVVFPDSRLISKVDVARVGLFANVSEEENANLTVSLLKERFRNRLQVDYSLIGNLRDINPNIKFDLQASIQSRDKYFVNGWVEDGFCVAGGIGDPCIQRTYITDFSVQALGTEAMLQVVSEQSYFVVDIVSAGVYWHSDYLLPGADMAATNGELQLDFPNLSASVRNKPAELIIKEWFRR